MIQIHRIRYGDEKQRSTKTYALGCVKILAVLSCLDYLSKFLSGRRQEGGVHEHKGAGRVARGLLPGGARVDGGQVEEAHRRDLPRVQGAVPQVWGVLLVPLQVHMYLFKNTSSFQLV